MGNYTYKKIYEQTYGKLPVDEFGRTYEIHHIDGNRANNDINNLQCVSIQEHFNIHYSQGDYGACVMIAKRMQMSPEYLSEIQKGKKRPGVGGVKKGTIPWNKGKNGYKLNLSSEGQRRKKEDNKRQNKITDDDAKKIRKDYNDKVKLHNESLIEKTMRNGLKMSYTQLFCKEYSEKYYVTSSYIRRIIKGKSKVV